MKIASKNREEDDRTRSLILSLMFFSALAFQGCQSKPKVATPPGLNPGVIVPTLPPLQISEATKNASALSARPVTSIGDNHEPQFSPDGSKLLYVSSQRYSHRQAQVYELDLVRSTERRVTFHDGDDGSPSWATALLFAYSSTTDEMKEGEQTIERLKNIAQSKSQTSESGRGGEVYIQRVDGREINRLTQSPGADVSPSVDPTSNGTRLAFSSAREGGSKIFILNRNLVRRLSDGGSAKSENLAGDFQPHFRQDGKAVAWERLEDGGKQSRIFVSDDLKTASALTGSGHRDRQPAWHPKMDAVIFSSDRGGSVFDIYVFDRKASCLKRMTKLEEDAFDPTFSADGSKIAFSYAVSSSRPLSRQIYVMEDRTASLPCLPGDQ